MRKEVTFGEGKNSLYSKDGTSIVIHAGVDDGMTQPRRGFGRKNCMRRNIERSETSQKRTYREKAEAYKIKVIEAKCTDLTSITFIL